MVVAVFAMLAMDVTLDHVVDVSVVRNRGVFATDAVNMIGGMGAAGVRRIARHQICGSELVFVDVVAMRMVQVGVVNVIDVVVMAHREMPAVFPVFVIVTVVNVRFHLMSPAVRGATTAGPRSLADMRALPRVGTARSRFAAS